MIRDITERIMGRVFTKTEADMLIGLIRVRTADHRAIRDYRTGGSQMTGFEEVEKLKELEQKATPGPWSWYAEDNSLCWLGQTGNEHENYVMGAYTCAACAESKAKCLRPSEVDAGIIAGLRNAAPLLLDIAGQIQPGDDKLLAQLVYEQEDLARFVAGFGGVRQSERVMIDLLKRYQKMAERMHENRTE